MNKRHIQDYPGWALYPEKWNDLKCAGETLYESPLINITQNHRKYSSLPDNEFNAEWYQFIDRMLHDDLFDAFQIWKWFYEHMKNLDHGFEPEFLLHIIFEQGLFERTEWDIYNKTERKNYCSDVKNKASALKTAINVLNNSPLNIKTQVNIPLEVIRKVLDAFVNKEINETQFISQVENIYLHANQGLYQETYENLHSPNIVNLLNKLIDKSNTIKDSSPATPRPSGKDGPILHFTRKTRDSLNKVFNGLGDKFKSTNEEALLASIAFNSKFTPRELKKMLNEHKV